MIICHILRRGFDNGRHDEFLRMLGFCVQLQSDRQTQVGQPHRGQHQGCGEKTIKTSEREKAEEKQKTNSSQKTSLGITSMMQ